MPSTSNSGFEPDIIDPAVRQQLRYQADQPPTWDQFHALLRHYGIAYHDQREGGPALIGLPLPQAPVCRVVRPGLTTDVKVLWLAMLKAIAEEPAAYPTIDALETDLRTMGVHVRGVGQDMLSDVSECKGFTAKLRRVSQLEPLEATYYPHALAEAFGRYAGLYIIDVRISDDGRFIEARDHRKLAGYAAPYDAAHAPQCRANLIDSLQRKITLKLLETTVAGSGEFTPPIWRIADEPLPTATAA